MGIITEQVRRVVEEAVRTQSPLVWLDKSGEYAPLVAKWQASPLSFPYPVFSFDGSFLELMLASKDPLGKKNASPCVIYMKGFDAKDIAHTPMYEACKAGQSWSVPLERIVREAGEAVLSSEQIEHILAREGLDIEMAERLADSMTDRAPEIDEEIDRLGEDGFIIAFLEGTIGNAIALPLLRRHFDRVFGCTDQWIAAWTREDAALVSAHDLESAVAAYLLCTEYAFDLSGTLPGERLPGLASRPAEYRMRIGRFLKALRREKPVLYAAWAERTELGLTDIEKNVSADKLGKLDTFRFEADIMLDAALDSLSAGDWVRTASYAEPRFAEDAPGENARTFWLKNDAARERMWKWIDATAKLGREIRSASGEGLKAESVIAAFGVYVSHEWQIDRLHREFRLITATITTAIVRNRYEDFLEIRSAMNKLYRFWADDRARSWNVLCARDRFALHRENAQRFFFERTIEPMLRAEKKTALLLVDAFRYELGEELATMLADYANGGKIISAMLAELPTVTAVGMNALMPVTRDGSLDPVFDKTGKKILGFRSGERQITTPETRQRSLAEYAGGRCEWTDLSLFLDSKGKDHARLSSARLLVVSTPDIDTIGESGTGTLGIDYFQPVLARLKQAVEKLRDTGFDRIVITADHGFLLGDESVENGHGARLEKADRRHAFDISRNGEQLVSVSLTELGWKTEDKESALVLDTGTHLLTSAKPGTFYHGGNSLQERVIPLIVLSGGAPVQITEGTYRIKLSAQPPVFGINRIKLTVECSGTAELFAPETVELRLLTEAGSRITIGDAGGMRFTGDTLEIIIGRETLVSFRIESSTGEKERVTVCQASSLLKIQPVITADYFETESLTTFMAHDEEKPSGNWIFPTGLIPGEYEASIRHLIHHGALSEAFIRNSLGGTQESSRKARRFAQKISEWQQYLPFTVTVRQTADGTEYRKA